MREPVWFSKVDPDPDARTRRWAWIGSALVLGAGLLMITSGKERLPFAMLTIGVGLTWPVYRAAGWLWRNLQDAPLADWDGSYYEFDGRQVRILFDEDAGRVWFCAADVFDAFGVTGMARNPRRVRQIAGRDGLVPAPGTRLLCFTERGLQAWLQRRTERVAGNFAHWRDKQVLAPFARRRELRGHPPAAATQPGFVDTQ